MNNDKKEIYISVIVTTYNCENYILETLESIQNQTFANYEVIIIDDKSVDNTRNLISNFISDKTNWNMYVNEVNKGVVYSRNRAFDLAAGRYIAILDGDDVWEKTKLEKQYDVLKDDAIDLCYSSYSYINEHSTPIRYIYHTREAGSYRSLLRENYIGCSTAVIKAYIAKNVKMNGNVSHEDYYYWLNLLKQDVAARGIDEPLVRYRIHSKSRSYNKIKAARNRFIIYYKYLDLGVFKSTFFLLVYFIKAAKKYFNIYMKKRY